MDKLIGTKLDGLYEIETLIGSGGMANVYKGKDLRNGRAVAVKVLREEYMTDPDLVRRFKNESKAISILDHPNIVKVYDVSVTDKLQYIVMEYVDGITLRAYLDQRGGKLTWRETVHFTVEILNALSHAHENGVVHRDVKPQNIMLLPDGSLRMMDFGIARISRAENQLLSGKAMGSVHYISPEQAKGDVTDAKSDIYSVGIMMYEMLSGKLPFSKGSVVEVAIKQISETPPPLGEIAQDVPQALIQITEHAMAKDPAQRYPNAAAMLEDIRKFKEDPEIQFEYKYMPVQVPEDVVSKAMKQTKNGPAKTAGKTTEQPAGKKPKNGKKKKFLPILFGATAAFCLGCAVMCIAILKNSSHSMFKENEDVLLTSFVGMSEEEAKKDPLSDKVKLVFEKNYSPDYASGQIYKQVPREGRTIKAGQEVKLYVSLGTRYEEIPPLRNMVFDDAEALLKEKGLYVMRIERVDNSVAVGTVIETNPKEGEKVEAGSTVQVFVSRENVVTTTKVPELVGLSYEAAVQQLASHRLSMGAQTHVWSELPEGTICAQSQSAGTKLKIGSRVSVTISDGPEPTEEPTEEPTAEPTEGKEEAENPAENKPEGGAATENPATQSPTVDEEGTVQDALGKLDDLLGQLGEHLG